MPETTRERLTSGGWKELEFGPFRDAVTITRKLGVRYLWIDSLASLDISTSQSYYLVEVHYPR